MRRITKEPWFGPKRVIGWGLTPITWQGWLSTVIFVGLAVGIAQALNGTATRFFAIALVLAVYLVAVGLTGTPPGRPGHRTHDDRLNQLR